MDSFLQHSCAHLYHHQRGDYIAALTPDQSHCNLTKIINQSVRLQLKGNKYIAYYNLLNLFLIT